MKSKMKMKIIRQRKIKAYVIELPTIHLKLIEVSYTPRDYVLEASSEGKKHILFFNRLDYALGIFKKYRRSDFERNAV